MLIIGAKGHAKEILDVIEKRGCKDIFFYDDVSVDIDGSLYGKYCVIRSTDELVQICLSERTFVLGVGNPSIRKRMAGMFTNMGWELTTLISNSAIVGKHNVIIGKGATIMHNVFISNDVYIGEGSLINAGANIHHDVRIGEYCEIAPHACVAGSVRIEDFSFVGAGAVILPEVIIGKNCTIGAGAVVTKNIPDNKTAVGIPAKIVTDV